MSGRLVRAGLGLVGLLLAPISLDAQDGAVVLTSRAPFGATVAALERAVADQQMTLVCRANAQQGAAARGVQIPGNQVFMIFRNDFPPGLPGPRLRRRGPALSLARRRAAGASCR